MTRQVSRTPARFPSGHNNSLRGADASSLQRMMGMNDPSRYHTYFNDFNTYGSGDWTITDVGSNTTAVTAYDGGAILVTTGTDNPASRFFQLVAAGFAPAAGYQMWFEIGFKTGSGTVTLPNIVFGLQALDTTPLSVTDGIYFIQNTGAATVDFIVKGSSTATTTSAIGTFVASTAYRYGFYYNGVDGVEYFVDGVKKGTAAVTNLPSANLTVSFGVGATTAAAQTLTVDWIYAVKERYIPNSPN